MVKLGLPPGRWSVTFKSPTQVWVMVSETDILVIAPPTPDTTMGIDSGVPAVVQHVPFPESGMAPVPVALNVCP